MTPKGYATQRFQRVDSRVSQKGSTRSAGKIGTICLNGVALKEKQRLTGR
jgi:hypothetical protein